MWIWLISIIIIVATWVAGYFLLWSFWLKALITLGAILLIVGYYGIRKIRAVRRANAIERDLMRQAELQAQNARPDRRAQIGELQIQMERGMKALRESNLGSSALYKLPWYMVVGPPGAGKTTALRHSGLVFPAVGDSGGGIKGVGGTRNCDWWFTNEAILLDTAGRYAIEADDHEEWIAFLALIRKQRPEKPINGVIVAMSVSEVLDSNDEKLDETARKIRARIDEVMKELRMVVPVYMMFTKVDLVAGFVEYFGDLKKSERGQIWGVTFPLLGAAERDARTTFHAEFDTLVDVCLSRALTRMHSERLAETRQKIFQFPIEFASLKDNIGELVHSLFQRSAFQDTPLLRGVYFTSGTQEGRPIDRVLGEMMKAFNIATGPHVPAPVGESKSYFVTDMFRKVAFGDQNLAVHTRAEVRRKLLRRVGFAAAASLITAMLVGPAACTFAGNLELVGSARRVATEAKQARWADRGASVVDDAKRIEDLRAEVRKLGDWEKGGAPLRYGWGMYVGGSLYPPLRQVYVAALEVGFVRPVRASLEQELRTLVAKRSQLTVEDYGYYFPRLRAYLLASDLSRLAADKDDWESTAMAEYWAKVASLKDPADKAMLQKHVQEYFRLMRAKEVAPWVIDPDLVKRAQIALKQVAEVDRDLSEVIREANDVLPPIQRETIFVNTNFAAYVASKSNPGRVVRGAFTKAGWNDYIRERFDKERVAKLAAERWVLGEGQEVASRSVEKQLKDLQERYFIEYRNEWRDFLLDLDIKKPETAAQSLTELQALSETPRPYLRLFKVVAENVRLEMPPPSVTDKAGERAGEIVRGSLATSTVANALSDAGLLPPPPKPKGKWVSPVEEDFEPISGFAVPAGARAEDRNARTKLDHYHEQIVTKLVGALTEFRDSRIPVKRERLREAFEIGARSANDVLSQTQSPFTRPLLAPLLLNPIALPPKY